MAPPSFPDSVLAGRATDPAVRDGLLLVDYPEYLIEEVLEGDGLNQLHASMGGEALTPEAVAETVAAMIAKHLRENPPAQGRYEERVRDNDSFTPYFPQPITGTGTGPEENPVPQEPTFDEAPATVNFKASRDASILMQIEGVVARWRDGKVSDTDARTLIEKALQNHPDSKLR